MHCPLCIAAVPGLKAGTGSHEDSCLMILCTTLSTFTASDAAFKRACEHLNIHTTHILQVGRLTRLPSLCWLIVWRYLAQLNYVQLGGPVSSQPPASCKVAYASLLISHSVCVKPTCMTVHSLSPSIIPPQNMLHSTCGGICIAHFVGDVFDGATPASIQTSG